jgi:hypothetical protein
MSHTQQYSVSNLVVVLIAVLIYFFNVVDLFMVPTSVNYVSVLLIIHLTALFFKRKHVME